MAKLYIAEFNKSLRTGDYIVVPYAQAPVIAEQVVAIGGASVQSAALGAATSLVRISTDVACSIAIGSNPTATVNTMRLAADSVEYFGVPAGQSYKIAVIANT